MKKESCTKCKHYRKIKGQFKKFKCVLNGIEYRRDNACFSFKKGKDLRAVR